MGVGNKGGGRRRNALRAHHHTINLMERFIGGGSKRSPLSLDKRKKDRERERQKNKELESRATIAGSFLKSMPVTFDGWW